MMQLDAVFKSRMLKTDFRKDFILESSIFSLPIFHLCRNHKPPRLVKKLFLVLGENSNKAQKDVKQRIYILNHFVIVSIIEKALWLHSYGH